MIEKTFTLIGLLFPNTWSATMRFMPLSNDKTILFGFILYPVCADWCFMCNFARKSLNCYGAREYFR